MPPCAAPPARHCAPAPAPHILYSMSGDAHLPALAAPDPGAEIAALARRWRRANGPVIALLNRFGGEIERRMDALPPALRARVEGVVAEALSRGFDVAQAGRHAPDLGPRGAQALAALTGALGGAGGLATALAELPVTVTVILHTIRRAAERAGFDPAEPAIRAECLRVLSSGSPAAQDDGVNTAFIGARLALSGAAVQKLIATAAPGLAVVLTQKLAAQTVPVIGAVTGATLNAAYLGYYRDLAEIRFALLRLSVQHGGEYVQAAFAQATAAPRVTRA